MSGGAPGFRRRLTTLGFAGAPETRRLRRIRAARSELRLADRSDQELRALAGGLREEAGSSGAIPERALARAYAVIDETIRRRLGCWRILELPATADEAESIGAARAAVAAAGRGRYFGGEVLLPAEFYRAVRRRRDGAGRRFHPTDQQILAGLHLWAGRIVELAAGEGKTVAAVFPAALHGLLGRTTHVITANDYLAARDGARMGPVYRALGLTVGAVLDHMAGPERREAYSCRIVYGTLREFAFDYLRDRLAGSVAEQLQGPLDAVIIDEADQTLLDEAAMPLVIAGEPTLSRRTIVRANRAVRELAAEQRRVAVECRRRLEQGEGGGPRAQATLLARALLADPDHDDTRRLAAAQPRLRQRARALLDSDGAGRPHPAAVEGLYCAVDADLRGCALLPAGVAFLESRLGDLYTGGASGGASHDGGAGSSRRAARRHNLVNQVHQLLRAHLLLRRDIDYVVEDDRVTLVDRDTGRPRPDARYQEGLQPAVEAKEGVTVHADYRSLAEISVPGFIRRYGRLAGVTGTAVTAADELRRQYGLSVAAVAAARPGQRRDWPSRVYAHREDQLAAIVDEVRHCRRWGRPTLVAARTVAQSAELSRRLAAAGIPHRVLNAAAGAEEADIVRAAGRLGAVTVATSMAGRGTDIILPPELDRQLQEGFVALLADLLSGTGAATAVPVQASTAAEAELLARAVAATPGLTATRRPGRDDLLTVRRRGVKAAAARGGTESGDGDEGSKDLGRGRLLECLEFGLGLQVVSAEFNESPRVARQLQGRSGRQGGFGATRSILVRSDRELAGLRYGRPGVDAAGRVCWQGPSLERQLRGRQAAAQAEAAAERAQLLEYAATRDAQGEAYYRARQEMLTATADAWGRRAETAAGAVAGSLVRRHFPGLAADDYAGRQATLAEELRTRYAVDSAPAWGEPLDSLHEALAGLLRQRVAERRERMGERRFGELARLLALQAGDELWETHRARLRAMAAVSRMEPRGPKTAVAEYIIAADGAWRGFEDGVSELFLSRLCLFPVEDLAGVPEAEAGVAREPAGPVMAAPGLARLVAGAPSGAAPAA